MPTDITSNDMFMYIDSSRGAIGGEATDATYKDHIRVMSLRLGVNGPDLDADKGAEAGQCQLQSIEVVIPTSAATPTLFAVSYSGELLKTVTISSRKAGTGQQNYIQWRFHNVQVASISHTQGADKPIDTLGLKCSKIEVIYFKQNADGTVETTGRTSGWDCDENKAMATTLPYKPGKK